MKKRSLAALLAALCLLLTACSAPQAEKDDTLHILATTYPVYLFTTAVTQGADGVEVSLLVNSQTSCLHDYTLTTTDMKAIEGADVIVMNGVGLEDFMSDALAQSASAVIDCSQGIDLLPALGHEGHGHDTEWDPHIWMDPDRAARMVDNAAQGLSALDPRNRAVYEANAQAAQELLSPGGTGSAARSLCALATGRDALSDVVSHTGFIAFHDGFQYFTAAFGLDLLKSIEEEEGSEASAADIREIVGLIEEYRLPAIFTEKNGSDATAGAIAREVGWPMAIPQLDMLMSGTALEDRQGVQAYMDLMEQNIQIVAEALK